MLVQAMSETDHQPAALTAVLQCYGSLAAVPTRIVSLCALMHIKVDDLPEAKSLIESWLAIQSNHVADDYEELASIYVLRVLYPLGKTEQICRFIQANSHLSPEARTTLLEQTAESMLLLYLLPLVSPFFLVYFFRFFNSLSFSRFISAFFCHLFFYLSRCFRSYPHWSDVFLSLSFICSVSARISILFLHLFYYPSFLHGPILIMVCKCQPSLQLLYLAKKPQF